jgi:hypothetical protein
MVAELKQPILFPLLEIFKIHKISSSFFKREEDIIFFRDFVKMEIYHLKGRISKNSYNNKLILKSPACFFKSFLQN